jgi:hypothetical protein
MCQAICWVQEWREGFEALSSLFARHVTRGRRVFGKQGYPLTILLDRPRVKKLC